VSYARVAPNEMQISCKRPVKAYVPYRLWKRRGSPEFGLVRVCRLHLRVRLHPGPVYIQR
jgi:hypothetical protein